MQDSIQNERTNERTNATSCVSLVGKEGKTVNFPSLNERTNATSNVSLGETRLPPKGGILRTFVTSLPQGEGQANALACLPYPLQQFVSAREGLDSGSDFGSQTLESDQLFGSGIAGMIRMRGEVRNV